MSNKQIAVPNHLLKLFETAEISINQDELTAKELMQEGIKHKQKSVLSAVAAGMRFSQARELEGAAFIAQEAKRISISRRTVYNDIAVYELFERAPQQAVQALAELDFTKLLQLNRLDNDELSDLTTGKEVRGITYDEVIVFPTRELERRFKDEKAEVEQRLEKQTLALAEADEQVRLYKKKQNSIEGFNYPPSVERVRIESSVLGSQAIQCLDDMEQFMVELTHATDLNKEKKKQEAEFSAGACTLFVNLKSVYSKASYLLKWFEETIGSDYMPTDPVDTPLLTQEEAMKIFNIREVMLIEHDIKKQVRENTRKSNRRKHKKAKE